MGKENGNKKILFVCTGNTCRSPMAEALFEIRKGDNSDWEADSAGTFAAAGMPASPNAIKAMKELEVDIGDHRSKNVLEPLMETAELVVTMTDGHRHEILRRFPQFANKVCLIKSFGTSRVPDDICDPFGGSLNTYRTIRDEIDRAIADLVLFVRDGRK